MKINFLLFDQFETLDAFGPAEVLASGEGYELEYYSAAGGTVTSRQNVAVVTKPWSEADSGGILVLPGGMGTRPLAQDEGFIALVREAAERSLYTLTICTGSALLAKAGLLDGRRATSNKRSFEWVKSTGPKVDWVGSARWVVDGKYYTSSGVSAGTDMALGFLAERFGVEEARTIAARVEYLWSEDPDHDPFAVE